MDTFLQVVLGLLAAFAIVGALGWWWFKRKVASLGDALGELLGALAGGVSPFRITLTPIDAPSWSDLQGLAKHSDALMALGYVAAGDYQIEEMDGVLLRGFCHRADACAAALYEHPQAAELMLDINRVHSDRTVVVSTNSPDPGLQMPPNKLTERVSGELDVAQMHKSVLAASDGREPVPCPPRLFSTLFAAAYAAEMDWRIERGGVTADEVRAAAAAGGQDEPDESQIALVQLQWSSAIAEFVEEQVLQSFVTTQDLSAAQVAHLRAIHAHTDVDDFCDDLATAALAKQMPSEDDYEDEDAFDEAYEKYDEQLHALRETLLGVASDGDVWQKVDAAVAALPDPAIIEFCGEVNQPWRSRIYVLPATAD